jgi:hypothetical protein
MKKVKYDYPEYRKKYYQKKKLKIDLTNIKFSDTKDPFRVYFD